MGIAAATVRLLLQPRLIKRCIVRKDLDVLAEWADSLVLCFVDSDVLLQLGSSQLGLSRTYPIYNIKSNQVISPFTNHFTTYSLGWENPPGASVFQELQWLFSDAKSPRGKTEPDRGAERERHERRQNITCSG